MGLTNVRFEVLDLVRLPEEPKIDLNTAFDVIHDQAQPAAVLAMAPLHVTGPSSCSTSAPPAGSRRTSRTR